jgi:hypothetical protein
MYNTVMLPNDVKGYLPDDLIVNYIHDKLQFEKKKNEQKLQGKDLAENETYSNLKKRKVDVVDKIFASMSNLKFFFDCIAKYQILEELFEDDIQDLLGIRRTNPQGQIRGHILSDLLYSILFVQNRKADFRLLLPPVLQLSARNKAYQFMRDVFKVETACFSVSNDLDRAYGWLEMLAQVARIEHDSEVLLKERKRKRRKGKDLNLSLFFQYFYLSHYLGQFV